METPEVTVILNLLVLNIIITGDIQVGTELVCLLPSSGRSGVCFETFLEI